ncbi:MAG: radical SAM protein [Candidatus Moranbacteria bacterium]|nr:radical SAM protein [Candidatus Moranbacteria bacterium]
MERKCDEKQVESLAIELTRDCNNNCLFCYQRKGKKTKVDVERLKRKIVEYRKMGVRYIEFSGGEPTLSSYLPGLIKLAKKEKYENISLLTNGRRLAYKKYFDSLIEAGLKTIIFSIPGHTAELYKKITQTDKESFYQLADALDAAGRERRKIEIGTVTVINKHNYRHLPKIVHWLAEKKLDFITLSYPIPFEEGMDQKIFPTCTEIYPFLKKTLDKYGRKAKICVDGVPYCQLPRYEKYILNEVFKKDCFIADFSGNVSSRLETVNLLAAKTKKCSVCRHKDFCPGFFVDYASKYDMVAAKKDFGEQKVAFDIQSGSCDYDYIFCTRQIDGKRFHELDSEKVTIDYEKLALFFRISSKISDHLDIWGRERADEFEDLFKVLKIAKKYFKNITLWSSGLNLNEGKKVKLLMKNGVSQFEIPIYGPSAKTNDSITRKKGSFEKIISTLDTMEKQKVKISLHTVLLKQNINELPQLIKLASKYKKAEFSAWFYYPDSSVDHAVDDTYKKHCPTYSEIIDCLSRDAGRIENFGAKFVFFPRCIFSKIKKIMRKAKLVETGYVRFMVADSNRMEYKFLTGRGEFGAIFPDKCNPCLLKSECPGVFSDYLKIYGNKELRPINK